MKAEGNGGQLARYQAGDENARRAILAGAARAADWDHVAYKGGSEPGVINMTTWVRKGARSHCVTATRNDPSLSVDDGAFASVYGRVIAALREP